MGEDLDLDMTEMNNMSMTVVEPVNPKKSKKEASVEKSSYSEPQFISPLRKEKITVKHVPRESGMVTNPKHFYYGGMADNAIRRYTVPILESSGTYVNVLTNDEKTFLEEAMGLDPNALSIYLKKDNFWANYFVRLTKTDNYLDLSVPDDYIKYKILLANKDHIAPSLTALKDAPKATYQFVLVSENDETNQSNQKLNASMEAYMLLGEYKEDRDMLKFIVETIDGRPISSKSKMEFILGQAQKLIEANAKLFVQVAKDKELSTKVLVAKAVEAGLVKKRGDFYYLSSDNTALCEAIEEPTLSMASKYLNSPKHQEVKLSLEAKLKSLKN